MSDTLYYLLSALLAAAVLVGIALMSRVKTAVQGNLIGIAAVALAVLLTLWRSGGNLLPKLLCLALAAAAGLVWAARVKMIAMPETVGLLNGVGGLASALVGGVELMTGAAGIFARVTAALAIVIGALTFTGSLVAAGKLAKKLKPAPLVFKGRPVLTAALALLSLAAVVLSASGQSRTGVLLAALIFAGGFGAVFALGVGGADMPITISLLNSLSGVAGAIAGMAVYNLLLVAVGGIVGASGLLLTQIMCRAMNRSLADILLGRTTVAPGSAPAPAEAGDLERAEKNSADGDLSSIGQARDVIIVPGYGMALSQAQFLVKELRDKFMAKGARVRFAIHPVAGRMPGHMNVLLCEADVDYEELCELDAINDDFESCDLAVVIGANDVLNPAAREAEGTPIYGMPILNVDRAKRVIICNYDLKPGYAGIDNSVYSRAEGVSILLGDAKESLKKLLEALD